VRPLGVADHNQLETDDGGQPSLIDIPALPRKRQPLRTQRKCADRLSAFIKDQATGAGNDVARVLEGQVEGPAGWNRSAVGEVDLVRRGASVDRARAGEFWMCSTIFALFGSKMSTYCWQPIFSWEGGEQQFS
jgi:hypothetical protein